MQNKNNHIHKHANMELAGLLLLLSATLAYTAHAVQFETKKISIPTVQQELEDINNELVSKAQSYRAKNNDQNKEKLEKILTLAAQRKKILKSIINKNPETILNEKIDRSIFPDEAMPFLEKSKTIEGFWGNLSANGTKYHIVRTASGELYWIHSSENISDIPTESRVRINGVQIDDDLVIESPLEKNISILN
jgi:hypothetical protein